MTVLMTDRKIPGMWVVILICHAMTIGAGEDPLQFAAVNLAEKVVIIPRDTAPLELATVLAEERRTATSLIRGSFKEGAPRYLRIGIDALGDRLAPPCRLYWEPLLVACLPPSPEADPSEGRAFLRAMLADDTVSLAPKAYALWYLVQSGHGNRSLATGWLDPQVVVDIMEELLVEEGVLDHVYGCELSEKAAPIDYTVTRSLLAASLADLILDGSPAVLETLEDSGPDILVARTRAVDELRRNLPAIRVVCQTAAPVMEYFMRPDEVTDVQRENALNAFFLVVPADFLGLERLCRLTLLAVRQKGPWWQDTTSRLMGMIKRFHDEDRYLKARGIRSKVPVAPLEKPPESNRPEDVRRWLGQAVKCLRERCVGSGQDLAPWYGDAGRFELSVD